LSIEAANKITHSRKLKILKIDCDVDAQLDCIPKQIKDVFFLDESITFDMINRFIELQIYFR
jgi:hypothetical protein